MTFEFVNIDKEFAKRRLRDSTESLLFFPDFRVLFSGGRMAPFNYAQDVAFNLSGYLMCLLG